MSTCLEEEIAGTPSEKARHQQRSRPLSQSPLMRGLLAISQHGAEDAATPPPATATVRVRTQARRLPRSLGHALSFERHYPLPSCSRRLPSCFPRLTS
eukprot:3377073-Pleurochrysis_carterae.AAC.1